MREEKAEMWGQNVDIRGQIKGLGAKRGVWGGRKGRLGGRRWGGGAEGRVGG